MLDTPSAWIRRGTWCGRLFPTGQSSQSSRPAARSGWTACSLAFTGWAFRPSPGLLLALSRPIFLQRPGLRFAATRPPFVGTRPKICPDQACFLQRPGGCLQRSGLSFAVTRPKLSSDQAYVCSGQAFVLQRPSPSFAPLGQRLAATRLAFCSLLPTFCSSKAYVLQRLGLRFAATMPMIFILLFSCITPSETLGLCT